MKYGPATLPRSAEVVIDEYVLGKEGDVSMYLAQQGLDPTKSDGLARLFSMAETCLDTVDLTRSFVEHGYSANNFYNDAAFENSSSTTDGFITVDSTSRLTHCITRLACDEGVFYIDPYWQQFMCNDFGITIDEIQARGNHHLQPTERVLCYEATDLPTVTSAYALCMRTLQDITKRRGPDTSEMFTRSELSIMERLLGVKRPQPVQYESISELEARAGKIWDPTNYSIVSEDELQAIQEENM